MNFPVYLLTTIIILIISAIAIMFSLRRDRKLKVVLEAQAMKRNGEVTNLFGAFGYPHLRFHYNSNLINVYSNPGSRYSPPHRIVQRRFWIEDR